MRVEGTHPDLRTVNTIDDANLAFDDITYDKGLAVLRMLEAYVGEEGLPRGRARLSECAPYGNARTQDLWTAVQAASGVPVMEIARSYTTQPGFPLLTAQGKICRRQANNGTIEVTQRRFALDEVSRTSELWSIPVVATRVGGQPVRAVLPPQAQSTIDVGSCGTYIVNAGQSAFFRVKYDAANFGRLTEAFLQLDAADQLGLLLDYFAFGRSSDGPMTDYLELAIRLPATPIWLCSRTTRNCLCNWRRMRKAGRVRTRCGLMCAGSQQPRFRARRLGCARGRRFEREQAARDVNRLARGGWRRSGDRGSAVAVRRIVERAGRRHPRRGAERCSGERHGSRVRGAGAGGALNAGLCRTTPVCGSRHQGAR